MNGDRGQRVHHLRPLSDAPTAPPVASPRSDEANGTAPSESAAAEISDTIVDLLRVHSGQAPASTETVVTSDLALVTLRDCLTTPEKTLADEGLSALAMEVRTALHDGIRPEATAAVEKITGRPVVAFLTAQHQEPDVAIIAFVFASPTPASRSRR